VKAVIEQVLEEEMTEHLAAYRERTPSLWDKRNGHYARNLITPVGRIEQLKVPRDREGSFLTEVFERYKRMTGEVEEAVLEMYLQGVSTRKVATITVLRPRPSHVGWFKFGRAVQPRLQRIC